MSEPLLEIKDLCVEFGSLKNPVRVLDHVNLHLAPGEILGIVGESGCGKSMTSLAVLRLIPSPPGRITKGTISLEGKNLLDLSEEQMQDVRGNDIAMIFQEPMTALNPVFTIGQQIIETIIRHERISAKQARLKAIDLIASVYMPEPERRLDQYPHELSGGMRQRAMIAMALACHPKVLIADEPTTALDVTVQAQIFDLLSELREKFNTAIILITHNMGAVAELADRVMVMYAGRKIEEGTVDRVLLEPLHPYTQGLLDCVLQVEHDPRKFSGSKLLSEIPGVVPPLSELGRGCAFAPRCKYVMDKCRTDRPPMMGTDNRLAACWLNLETAAAQSASESLA
ncbi:ABC transporter ATP-binding protein [Paralcaligenes ureilyticus]|uniref:Peptide/nickel transport system ATP-binding protein/oligopeptide transport system ATP-binding protein n=1 Tax=Paralcaligenes ureilyticus TaxID=627131 RepID=A0A4R3MBX7_9BURK|nr:ABC transporter ATP-binding protein [Paralcaligenes ureilyticus]TCT09759.1 peptide/nickel transport system ATP-binding protein/oligopeptide transport system ATP-binding protein [Paralcaligenes ureilyticus]